MMEPQGIPISLCFLLKLSGAVCLCASKQQLLNFCDPEEGYEPLF